MRKKLYFIVFIELVIALVVVAFVSFARQSSAFKSTLTDDTSLVLIGPEYKKVRDGLVAIVNKQDPRVAITQLRHEMTARPKVLASCHELFHEIGRASYKKYNNFVTAMLYRDDICVAGYTHGVIEAYFAESKHNLDTLTTLCETYPIGKYTRWECSHGLGHGLMFVSDDNVPWALTKCNSLKLQFDQEACANGVYMQNFNADTDSHPSKYISFTDPFQACRLQTMYPNDCYFNAPIYYLTYRPGDFTGVMRWCDTTPSAFRNSCYGGAGSQITRRMFDKPKWIEQFCVNAGEKKKNDCILGMMSWYVDYYNAVEPANKICMQFATVNQPMCQKAIEGNEGLF